MNINRCIVVFIKGEEMTNKLSKYFRQPALYIKLPTGGKFNPELDQTVLDEVGILPMTAVDEITMKNPDALLNGEALLSVIKSCVPAVRDAKKLCNIDAEAIYYAIQYATYGNEITHTHTCSKCEEKSEFNIDINYVLNRFPDIEILEPVEWQDVKIHIQPPTVESMTRLALIELEQRKLVKTVKDSVLEYETTEGAEQEVAQRFYKSFRKIAEHNVNLLANTIRYVETPDGIVEDYESISEFLDNIPTKIVDTINENVKKVAVKPTDISKFEFVCPECEQKDTVDLEVNPVNFFVSGS